MKLNFASIKAQFFKYLEEKQAQTGGGTTPISADTSIFSYASEWSKFLKENKTELGLPANFSGSIMDIISSYDEKTGEFKEDKKNSEKNFFTDFLNDLLGNDEVKKLADTDGKEGISKDELTAFLQSMDAYDDKEGVFSLDDMFKGYDAIKDGSFKLSETPEVEEPESTPEVPQSGGDGGGGVPPTPSVAPTPSTEPTTEPEQKDLTKMSVEELTAERTDAISKKDLIYDEMNKAINGEGAVKEYKDAADAAYEKFQTALKEKDSELAEKYDTAKKDVEAKQKLVDENDLSITKKESEQKDADADLKIAQQKVESIKSNISTLESNISSLEASLATAKEEEKAAIQAQIDEAKSKLESAKSELKTAEDAVTAAQTKLDTIKGELETLNGEKTKLEEELKTAKDGFAEIEKQVNELANPETNKDLADLKTAYDEAQKTYETKKTEATNDLKSVLKQQEDYIDKIAQQIPETQRKENEKKYSPDSAEKDIETQLTSLGATGSLDITQNPDGSYNAVEKLDDGVQVSYKFDKDGKMISYTNAMGTFEANGNSVTLKTAQGEHLYQGKELQSTVLSGVTLEDIIKSVKASGPKAEAFIDKALNKFDGGGYNQQNGCVVYADAVFTDMGHSIGSTSDAVKSGNQEISREQAKTGDIFYNGNRHIGMVLLNIKTANGDYITITADHTSNQVNMNTRKASNEFRYFKGISA